MSAPAVSSPERSSPGDLHPDDQALARYSAISRGAILAVFLGLASALVLVSPIFVVVSLAAAATAVVALRQISFGGGQYSGRWPATIGLCLAMLFTGWGFTRQWTRQATLAEQARQFADGWLQLVREGKQQKAHQMTGPAGQRLNSDQSIAEFYKTDKEAGENLQSFFSREPLKSLLAMPATGAFRFQSVAEFSQHGFEDEVVLQYAYGDSGPGAKQQQFWITVNRQFDERTKLSGWRIGTVAEEAPSGNR